MKSAAMKANIREDLNPTVDVDQISLTATPPAPRNSTKQPLHAVQVGTGDAAEILQGPGNQSSVLTKTSSTQQIRSFLAKLFASLSIPGQCEIDRIDRQIRMDATKDTEEIKARYARQTRDQLIDPEQARIKRTLNQNYFIYK